MPALFRLKKPIGPNHVVDPDDTVRTKAALARLGYFEAPEEGITPWPDTPMITAIMDFQQARGLEPDGVINRGGPTEQAIQVQLDAQSDRPTTRRPDVDVSAASPRTRSFWPKMTDLPAGETACASVENATAKALKARRRSRFPAVAATLAICPTKGHRGLRRLFDG